MVHEERRRGREPDLPGAGGPQPPSDFRVAHAWRSGGEGAHGALRHIAAGGLAAPRSPGTTAGDDGPMTVTDTTARAQTESISFEFDLRHSPEKVWRALTDPALLA